MPGDAVPERTLCVWCPDWPVAAARRAAPALADVPVAVVDRIDGRLVVQAASRDARAEGVVPGLRRREAEARCPGLVVLPADPSAEARAFEAVVRAVEAITPRVVLEQPGVLTFPTRGPARYFGGDGPLARLVLDTVRGVGVCDAGVGVADGAFAAGLAARAAAPGGTRVVEPGTSAAFLAPWPVEALGPEAAGLAGLLVRLGLPTLGAFASLPGPAVLARFGTAGARAHRLASGLDEHRAPPAPPPPDLVEAVELDPPATRVDEVAFVVKAMADRFLARLGALGLSCSCVSVETETEHGEQLTRCWRHDGAPRTGALVARVRWQLDAWVASGTTGGLTTLRLVPVQVVPADGRQLGFWGGDAAAGDRADRVLARLQGMLGHEAVVTARPCGGRTPAERVQWVPWGEARDAAVAAGRDAAPWPGTVPGPAPARVYAPALPAALLDEQGRPVTVSGRGEAAHAPARLECATLPDGGGAVRAWAGPWVQDVRWWDRVTRRRRALWHVVVGDGDTEVACLVGIEGGRAFVEAVYD